MPDLPGKEVDVVPRPAQRRPQATDVHLGSSAAGIVHRQIVHE
jgi:hypothetical protein